jgi:hypothetical protein
MEFQKVGAAEAHERLPNEGRVFTGGGQVG